MFKSKRVEIVAAILGMTSLSGATGMVAAQEQKSPFPAMAPVQQYRMASAAEEIALARSAAPESISKDAEILVLGERGYETAVKGKNGFTCLVERSWFAAFDDPQFWNPDIRGPDCLNRTAARSVLPVNLERTTWALAGLSKAQMTARAKTSAVAQQAPAPGAMGYMLSKQQRLGDGTHWHPHMMFFQPYTPAAEWGAGLPGSPVFASPGGPAEPTVFVIPVGKWSDGTSASTDAR